MKRINYRMLTVAAMTVALTGCQTTDGTQDRSVRVHILGVVLGSITGAFTDAVVGTAVSIATGLATFAINNYRSKQVNSTAEERRIYGATRSITKPQVKIQKTRNTPIIVKAGWKVTIQTIYWLNLPRGQSTAPVAESWTIKGKNISPVTLGPTRGKHEGKSGRQPGISWFRKGSNRVPM